MKVSEAEDCGWSSESLIESWFPLCPFSWESHYQSVALKTEIKGENDWSQDLKRRSTKKQRARWGKTNIEFDRAAIVFEYFFDVRFLESLVLQSKDRISICDAFGHLQISINQPVEKTI